MSMATVVIALHLREYDSIWRLLTTNGNRNDGMDSRVGVTTASYQQKINKPLSQRNSTQSYPLGSPQPQG